MELTAVVGKTSSTEHILGHHLTSRRLSSNIAGAFEDVSVCTLLFGERERKLDYVTSPVFNKLYIESPYGVTWVCLIFWLTSNPFIWVSSLTFCKQDSFILLSIYSHNRKVLVILPLKTSRNIEQVVNCLSKNPFFKKPDKHKQKGKKSNNKQTSK